MKAVFSDIDGTLSKGFVTVDFIRFLGKKGLLRKEAFLEHEALMQDYAEGRIGYLALVPKWSQSVANCLSGLKVSEVKPWADEFFLEWKKNIYPSTKPLIALLREKGYLVFFVSAAWDYLSGLAQKEMGANGTVGMQIRVVNGKYAPVLENDMCLEEGKKSAIKELIKEHNIDAKKTMGLGDSIQDRAIFESVHKPIALNPSKELEEKALKEKWYLGTHQNVLQMMKECFAKEIQ